MINEFLSGFAGALVGAVVPYFTLRYNYRQLYAEHISKSRMQWIDNFREELATVIAALKAADSAEKLEGEKARAKLLTRINTNTSKLGNEYNEVFAEILKSIDFGNMSEKSVYDVSNALLGLSRKILEFEWKRVKKEAGGKER